MNPFGLLFVGAGALLLRQVVIGRAEETPSDLRDLTKALLSNDNAGVQEVLSRRGTNVDSSAALVASGLESTPDTSDMPMVANSGDASRLYNTAVKLGEAAKGYMWGATGPNYYDCSGLVWRAARKVGLYKGARFTTSTHDKAFPTFAFKETVPNLPATISRDFGFQDFCPTGAILVWPGQHMGIVRSGAIMYSARGANKSPQIGESDFISDSEYFGDWPEIWIIGER